MFRHWNSPSDREKKYRSMPRFHGDHRRTRAKLIDLVRIADKGATGILEAPVGGQISPRMTCPKETCSGQRSQSVSQGFHTHSSLWSQQLRRVMGKGKGPGRADTVELRMCQKINESTFERMKYGFTTVSSYHMLWW